MMSEAQEFERPCKIRALGLVEAGLREYLEASLLQTGDVLTCRRRDQLIIAGVAIAADAVDHYCDYESGRRVVGGAQTNRRLAFSLLYQQSKEKWERHESNGTQGGLSSGEGFSATQNKTA